MSGTAVRWRARQSIAIIQVALLVACLNCFGCAGQRGEKPNAVAKLQEQKEEEVALEKALAEIDKVHFFSLTNGNYTLDKSREGDGTYRFRFTLTDTPDVTIVARISTNGVDLKGGWFPE